MIVYFKIWNDIYQYKSCSKTLLNIINGLTEDHLGKKILIKTLIELVINVKP